MIDRKTPQYFDKTRAAVGKKVQALRRERRWTQAELSRRLNLSQSRLSEIEGGGGSFTAEQFLEILKLFNVPASDFAPAGADPDSELQNALARLGATHLQESAEVVPNERRGQVTEVVREALVAGAHPRLITALAPVLVRNVDEINLRKLYLDLSGAGLDRRLAWVVENTVEAIRGEVPRASASERRVFNRARVVLASFLDAAPHRVDAPRDILEPGIRSKRTLEEVEAAGSEISRRWGIVTSLQPEDFARALRGVDAAHP
jgi:transcriptional regulator with XRE-family HTH domain